MVLGGGPLPPADGGPPATPPLGTSERDARLGLGAAAVTVAAAALTPTLPWHAGPVLLVLAGVAALDRAWLWGAVGAAVVWAPAVGSVGEGSLVGAGLAVAGAALAVHGWRALSTGLVLVGAAVAAKQLVAAEVLPAAAGLAPWAAGAAVGAALAASAARGSRVEALGLALAGGVVLARLAGVWTVDGVERVRAADRIDAVPLVYDALVAEGDPAVAEALLRAVPDRDGAAGVLGWERALEAGWRPARADGDVIAVARALEARGRGGEARRLLAKHPREGEVDGLRALYERLEGLPVKWRGAALGPTLPGRFDPGVTFETNGWVAVEWTATAELPELLIEGEGTSLDGPPVLTVRLDAGEPVVWPVDGAATLRIPGPLAPGPHRLAFSFENDAVGPDGDRNVRVVAIGGP